MNVRFPSYFVAFIALLSLISGCDETERGEASDNFDVQFVLPVGVETSTGLVTFTVIDGKAPLLTDSFILEPVSNTNVSYPCDITETSSESFTVELSPSCVAGQYNIYIKRGSQRKPYGGFYLGYVMLGETLPVWFEGEMDIHFINTGHGECTYQILPDGTTFLADASGALSDDSTYAPWKPNDTATAGQTIVNYINHFSPSVSKGHLDYCLLTHHHSDHMGTVNSSVASHSSGLFQLSSLPEIGSKLVIDRMFDRDWPDFSYPQVVTSTLMTNYKAFLDWTAAENGTVIEKWRVGSRTQVSPVHSSDWDVTIRTLAGSGWFWTGGADEESYTELPSLEECASMDSDAVPNENCMSCAYMLSYGKFDFFLGGDLVYLGSNGSSYIYDAEAPLIDIVHKVEVMKADHHGCDNGNSANLMNKLAPDVWLVGVYLTSHPSTKAAQNVINANPDCDIYTTWLSSERIENLGEKLLDRIVSQYGHVVVRVAQGGGSYMVYTLEDTDEEYTVKSINGPYICID